jgi:hypothetical protein
MTKTWGFGSPSGPLQFNSEGWRARARESLKDGDLVVIVGTRGKETIAEERGRVLGLMEPTTQPVSSLDFDLGRRPEDFDEAGNYKWPYGLELRRAWRFNDPRPMLTDIASRRFHMDAAQGIVPLQPHEADAILALPRTEVALLTSAAARARIEGSELARRKGAPPPTTTRRGIMHMRRAPAFTYAMEISGAATPAVKIGWAFDWSRRERGFNQAAMPGLGGLRYRTKLHHLFDSAHDAFRMEQWLLRRFANRRHAHNGEIVVPITMREVEDAWLQYLAVARRA